MDSRLEAIVQELAPNRQRIKSLKDRQIIEFVQRDKRKLIISTMTKTIQYCQELINEANGLPVDLTKLL